MSEAQYWQKWSDAINCVADARMRDETAKRDAVIAESAEKLMDFAASTAGEMAKMLLAAADEKIAIAIGDGVEYMFGSSGFCRLSMHSGLRARLEEPVEFRDMLRASISLRGTDFLKDPVAGLRARLDQIADDLQRKYAKL